MDLKTKADQRRVGAAAKSSAGRAHRQRPSRTDIQDPRDRRRAMPVLPETSRATLPETPGGDRR